MGITPRMTELQTEKSRRPEGLDDATVEAVGKVSEALECVERARGELYSFHQLIGHADLLLGEACDELQGRERHVFEEEMKERRRTDGRRGHERRP